jgi:hypothetical protein
MVISHIRCFSALATLLAGPLFFLGGPAAAQTASPPVLLIRSGYTVAPDGSIYVFDSVMTPVINASGQIAFYATLSGPSSRVGIVAGTPGALQIVAKNGDAAPSGGNFSTLNYPVLNSAGQVAFFANTSVSGGGIFARTPGFPATTAALVGTATPATGNYAVLNNPVLNASGQVAFLARTSFDDFAIFAGTPGTALTTVALQGTASPSGGTFNQVTTPALNSAGKVLFRASLNGSTSSYGLFFGTPGTTLTPVALSSSTSPAGGIFGLLSSTPTVNAAGQVAFISDRNGNSSSAIFAGTPGTTLTSVALQGNAAPAGGNYNNFANLELNAAGQVALVANLTGGSSTQGVFVGTPGQPLQTIALNGSAAPSSSGATYNGMGYLALNASGQVAFISNLSGAGVNFSNDTGLYAGSPGNVVKIAREGDTVDIDPTAGVDNRIVSGISFYTSTGFITVGSGGEDGRPVSFNDSGALVYRLDFSGGDSGIFMSSIAPVSTPGDHNQNGKVDAADYALWRKSPGTYGGSPTGYDTWRANFGQPPGSGSGTAGSASTAVPEPTASVLLLSMVAGLSFLRRRAVLPSQKVVRA